MSLTDRDKRHIWHPLTQHQTADAPLPIVRANGALLYDEKGNAYIDGIASWYTAMYGHCHPHIAQAVARQMETLDQVVFTGLTHEPAVRLAERLLEKLPDNQAKVFFNDNGSTAVEAAIKMAIQYYHNKGEQRDTLVAFEDGFHGDTFGAMSASGLSVYNGPFEDFMLKVERIDPPNGDNLEEVLGRLEELVDSDRCLAFVYEPLVQGAAGMKMHSAHGLDKLIALCKKHQVLTIADEVMTGFGKTGRDFASLYLQHYPDIICLSKALTAAAVPMGLTCCSEEVFDGFLSNEYSRGFFHAHTYSANPVACAAALAGLDLLESEEVKGGMRMIARSHAEFAQKLKGRQGIKNLRTLGVILAFELDMDMERYGTQRNRLYREFIARGVILRPLGNTIYILPPYLIEYDQLQAIYTAIEKVVGLFVGERGE